MPFCATVFLSMSAVTTSGLPEIMGGRGRVSVRLDEAKSISRRKGYLHLRRCASTSRSHHRRGQYRAGDAPSLQPIPEYSGAGNQLTKGSDKRGRIDARNTGLNRRRSRGQTPRYPVRIDANPIASRYS